MQVAAAISAVLLAGVAILVVTLLRDVRPTGAAPDGGDDGNSPAVSTVDDGTDQALAPAPA